MTNVLRAMHTSKNIILVLNFDVLYILGSRYLTAIAIELRNLIEIDFLLN